MQSRHRPALECLESRLLPAVLQNVPAVDGGLARVAELPDAPLTVPPTLFPGDLGRMMDEPFQTVATVDANPEFDTGAGQVFFSPPTLPDPLMTQLGRLNQPDMRFPASGGGESVHYEGYFLAAAPPEAQPEAAEAKSDANAEDGQEKSAQTEEMQEEATEVPEE